MLRLTKGDDGGQFSILEFDPIYNDLLFASQFNSYVWRKNLPSITIG